MKKEFAAWALIIMIAAAALFSASRIKSITDSVGALAERTAVFAESGDWESASKCAQRAASLWKESESYALIIMHHSDVSSASDALFDLLAAVYSQSGGDVSGLAAAAEARFESIGNLQSIRFESVF